MCSASRHFNKDKGRALREFAKQRFIASALLQLWLGVVFSASEPLECPPRLPLPAPPQQPRRGLGQPPAQHEEEEAGRGEGGVVELDGHREAQAEAEQPAAVGVEGVEGGEVAAESDEADLGEQGVAGDLH